MSLTIVQYPERIVDENPLFLSKWSSINHPMIFKLQRQDYPAQFFYNDTTEVLVASITSGTMIDSPVEGDKIYVGDLSNPTVFILDSFSFPNIFIMKPQSVNGTISPSGFINLLSRENYFVRTNVYGISESNQYDLIGQSINKPSILGEVNVDTGSFIKNIVGYQNNFKYDVLNQKDETLGSPYNITYSENWNGYEGVFSGLSQTDLRFGVNSAKQIQDLYGQNMGEYVTFYDKSLLPVQSPLAKFLSDFESPTYFPGFPFSLSFIYSEALAGITTNKLEESFNINEDVVTPANQIALDNSQSLEVNRLTISRGYSTVEKTIKVWLETDGVIECLKYVTDGYVTSGYVEEICDIPPVDLPYDPDNSPIGGGPVVVGGTVSGTVIEDTEG